MTHDERARSAAGLRKLSETPSQTRAFAQELGRLPAEDQAVRAVRSRSSGPTPSSPAHHYIDVPDHTLGLSLWTSGR
jgi:hypothetical protein